MQDLTPGFLCERALHHALRILGKIRLSIFHLRYRFLHLKYREFTMIGNTTFADNLVLCHDRGRSIAGCVVECGVWRGGTSAAMAEVMGSARPYYLFDSFEGLPPANIEKDGAAAVAYQADKDSPLYHDNCSAEIGFAERAMALSGSRDVKMIKGWFSETLPSFKPSQPIAVLRLDGDWYDSIMVCLQNLYQHVAPGGLIIFDDYYTWDGCCRALHDFLSRHQLTERIQHTPNGVAYLVKR